MKSQSPLITLRDLAQDAVEQAAQQLGQYGRRSGRQSSSCRCCSTIRTNTARS